MVDEPDKILLCVTYKVASRQLKRIIAALTGVTIKKYAGRPLFHWLNQYSPGEQANMAENYFKFIFVREPLERLLSGFLDKFYREPSDYYRKGYGRTIIGRYRKNPSTESLARGHDVKFEEYIQFILDGNRDEHWDRFYSRCHPCALEYDFIGYFEDMQHELPHALHAAGVQQVPMQIPYVSHNTTTRVREYFSQLPKQMLLDIAELYKYDYELFGYPFPGPLYTDLLKNAPWPAQAPFSHKRIIAVRFSMRCTYKTRLALPCTGVLSRGIA